MATKSRTYLPSDWQIWTYTPVSGKFRLDFSKLDGSDVLGGSTDTGSIAVMPLKIASIDMQDGLYPTDSLFSSFDPGTMSFSATVSSWDTATINELYNGKQIFLTLKNEATNSHPTFGKNTVFFIGVITDLNIAVDPINQITTINVACIDIAGTAANTVLTYNKSSSGKDIDIAAAVLAAKNAGQMSTYLQTTLYGLLSTYEATGTVTKSFGEIMTDFIASDVAIYSPYIQQEWTGSAYNLYKQIACRTIATTGTTGETIPYSIMTDITVTQDGGNVPTAFNLANSASSYSYGTTTASTLTNPRVYMATLDVPNAFLQTVADKIRQYTSAIQPTEVTVKTAQTYQTIIFDNNEGDYIWPQYFWRNDQEVKTIPTYLGGVTYYHRVVGTRHSITPDNWQTTYSLLKGL